ncbi:MAG: cobalt ECF transporter T component CbiQ [Elusimicrobiota bacterium]
MRKLFSDLDARIKFIAVLAMVITVVLIPQGQWGLFTGYFVFISILLVLSQTKIGFILKRLFTVLPFILMITIFTPFFKEGNVVFTYNFWWGGINVTKEGLALLLGVITKSILSVLSILFLLSTTTFSELLNGFIKMKVPGIMVLLLSFMYRYMDVLITEMKTLERARDARYFGGKIFRQIGMAGNIVATLFLRALERSERVYAALLARGYNGGKERNGFLGGK